MSYVVCEICQERPVYPGRAFCRPCITRCTICDKKPSFPACPECAALLTTQGPGGQTRCRDCQEGHPCKHQERDQNATTTR